MVVLLRLAACSTSLLIGLTSRCFAHRARASCAPATATPSIRNGRPAAPYGLQYSLAHWAYYGLFRALRAAFVRPTGCAASFALIGVFVPACASLARYSGAADALWACPRPSTPSGLRRLRPVSRTARGLRAPHWLRRLFRPHWAYSALLRAQRVLFVRPFGQSLRRGYAAPPPFTQGRLWGSAAYCDSATNQKAPLDSKGSCRR